MDAYKARKGTQGTSRREFLRQSGLGLAATVATVTAVAYEGRNTAEAREEPRQKQPRGYEPIIDDGSSCAIASW